MNIIITGASGFVGKYLCAALQTAHPQAKLFGITLSGDAPEGVTGIKANMSHDDLCPIFKAIQPSLVYHLAAHSSVAQSLGAGNVTFEENVKACMNLSRAMREEAKGCTLVFASSSEVYGASFKTGIPLNEETPPQPQNPYARSKLAGEFVFKDCLSDICPVIVLRLFNHYGKGQDERFVMGSFMAQIDRIKNGKQAPIIQVGNLDAVRDFLTVDEVMKVYIDLSNNISTAPNYDIYNICSGEGKSIRNMLDDLIINSGLTISIEVDKSRLRPSEIPYAVGDSTKFQARKK